MRILVAEDDLTTRTYLVTLLERAGNEVIVVVDGDEAWLAMQKENAPSMLLLDWIMPGMDGGALCRAIRAQEREVKPYIIMLTVKGEKEDIVFGLDSGADDYLPKPYDARELFARIEVGRRMLGLQETLVGKINKINNLLAEKELILQEVHHRIKNNMNTICSLLSLQSGMFDETAVVSALRDAEARVQSMVILYDTLYRAADYIDISVSEYLPILIDTIIDNFPNKSSVKIQKNIDGFILDIKRMQAIGIIVNELLTNIMKYAFTGKNEGLIKVVVSLNVNLVTVIIADNGNGMPDKVDFENPGGFGLVLVKGLTEQLHGKIRIERENGTRIVLEFMKDENR